MSVLLSKIRRTFRRNSFIKSYLENKRFRVRVSLVVSLIFNALYMLFNVISGLIYKSASFFAIAVYYALITSIRYIILAPSGDIPEFQREKRACRTGGALLLVTDVIITAIICYSVYASSVKRYGAAVFTILSIHCVYTVVRALTGLAGARRDGIPTHRAAYSVRLASVSMSFFNLSSAVITQIFGDSTLGRVVIMILSVAVSLAVLFLSLSMIFIRKEK